MPRGDNLSVGISQKGGKKSAASREKRVRRLQLLSELGTQAKKEKLQKPKLGRKKPSVFVAREYANRNSIFDYLGNF